MGMEQWEKEAKQTYKTLVEQSPTKENMLLMGAVLTVLCHEKLMDIMEYMGKNQEYERYDRYDRGGYPRYPMDRRY